MASLLTGVTSSMLGNMSLKLILSLGQIASSRTCPRICPWRPRTTTPKENHPSFPRLSRNKKISTAWWGEFCAYRHWRNAADRSVVTTCADLWRRKSSESLSQSLQGWMVSFAEFLVRSCRRLAHEPITRAIRAATGLDVRLVKSAGNVTSSLRGRMYSVSEFGSAYAPTAVHTGPEFSLQLVAKKKE